MAHQEEATSQNLNPHFLEHECGDEATFPPVIVQKDEESKEGAGASADPMLSVQPHESVIKAFDIGDILRLIASYLPFDDFKNFMKLNKSMYQQMTPADENLDKIIW